MEATVDTGVRLAPHETAEGRGFTDPARTADDLAAVRVMLATVRHLTEGPAGARPFVLEAREADGREHRTVICNGPRVRDDELIREFPAHPGILSYSSLEVGGGDWGNLILVAGDDAREHWRTSERHAHAVRELAPRHYTDVRLHVGA